MPQGCYQTVVCYINIAQGDLAGNHYGTFRSNNASQSIKQHAKHGQMNDFFLEQSKLVCGLCRMSSR
jgi:hypothetical protein